MANDWDAGLAELRSEPTHRLAGRLLAGHPGRFEITALSDGGEPLAEPLLVTVTPAGELMLLSPTADTLDALNAAGRIGRLTVLELTGRTTVRRRWRRTAPGHYAPVPPEPQPKRGLLRRLRGTPTESDATAWELGRS